MRPSHLAVVMPAYNEAGAIGGFIDELVEHLAPHADSLSIVVVNDRSTDDTASVLDSLRLAHGAVLHASTSPVNQGHGPTAIAAYLAGLETGADLILHIDGDGQFLGEELPQLLTAIDGADVVHGVRRDRTDPWFRKVITGIVFAIVGVWTRSRVPDVNTPLRLYRPEALRRLLAAIPAGALVPHVHFSVLECKLGMIVHHVRVRSIPRRGDSAAGTMWGPQTRQPFLPPARLRRFVRAAAGEVFTYRIRQAAVSSPALRLPADA